VVKKVYLIMRILFYLGHPAHFHLFKNVILKLSGNGHEIAILIKKKDILEELLKRSNLPYINILPEGRRDNKAGIAAGVVKRDLRLLKLCLKKRPDILVGTSAEIGHIGSLLRIPSINVNEDDAGAVPLFSKLSYPFSTHILSPSVCDNGIWETKSIKYAGYHELAYLHPSNFTPSKVIAGKYLPVESSYFLIRFAKLNAHHDKGITGITDDLALKIIDILKPFGNIYITSERKFDDEFEPYRLQIDPLDIHHVMAFASLYIGDSQTMAAESGVLGVPFVRFNGFVGRLGYLNELENKYQLGYGIKPSEPERLLEVINDLVRMKNRSEIFKLRQLDMLKDKIKVTEFMVWLIENYPASVRLMKENPEYDMTFK
jgi:predicted glycosyltransferase